MWTTLSGSRWICVLTLAAMMLSAASQALASGPTVPCRSDCSYKKIHVIKECFEQIQRTNCEHAFVVKNKKGSWCIKEDAVWLNNKIKEGKLHCPPDLSF